jgi:tRNA threonylcarbamoyl adenosine modification protein YjeE
MQDRKVMWTQIGATGDLEGIAQRVVSDLCSDKERAAAPFCLWLVGGLGAGKTTFTGAFLRALGLPQGVPVTSPTYTLMNEYRCHDPKGDRWYAHLDLYRAENGCDLYELGVFDTRDFSGYLIEWPERLVDPTHLPPSHILSISMVENGSRRLYKLEKNLP